MAAFALFVSTYMAALVVTLLGYWFGFFAGQWEAIFWSYGIWGVSSLICGAMYLLEKNDICFYHLEGRVVCDEEIFDDMDTPGAWVLVGVSSPFWATIVVMKTIQALREPFMITCLLLVVGCFVGAGNVLIGLWKLFMKLWPTQKTA